MTTDSTLMNIDLPFKHLASGKVREIYEFEDKLLIVTTDRLSAFDVVLPDPIPSKGKVLTQISSFWMNKFSAWMPHHLITCDVNAMGFPKEVISQYRDRLEGRSMLVKKARPLTIECVVRGYVTGSGWKDYQETGSVCGHKLPQGLKECEKLETPIFTPATKAVEGHDINISFEEAVELEGEKVVSKARDYAIRLYEAGRDYAAEKGILIADTKFEFGLIDGELILIDEALTPDSSRFWPKDLYEAGHDQPSFDKQIIRNYLLTLDWDKTAPGPKLPEDIISKTAKAYQDVYQKLTGKVLNA